MVPPVETLVPGVYVSRTCSTTRLITLGVGRGGAAAAGFGALRGAAGLRAALFFTALFFTARFFAGRFAALFFALLLLPRRADARFDALRERLDFFDDFERPEEDFFDRFLVAMRFLLCQDFRDRTAVAVWCLAAE